MKNFWKDFHTLKVNETDKIKRREAIIYKIVKQLPSENDKWYVKIQQRAWGILYWKGKWKKNIVIESSGKAENKKRRMRKRKNKESIGNKSRTTYYEKKTKKIAAKKLEIALPETKPKRKTKEKQK